MKKLYLPAGLFLMLLMLSPASIDANSWERVGTLVSDASRDESALVVESLNPIQEGQAILLESRDGSYQEVIVVRHRYGHNLILETNLLNEFVAGARIYQ